MAIKEKSLFDMLVKQLSSNFLLSSNEIEILSSFYEKSLERTIICIDGNRKKNKYYEKSGNPYFNPFHSVQYMMFLYYFSNEIYKNGGDTLLCDKIYYLNKIFNAVDIFYPINLPNYFFAEHPVGTVLGRATYNTGFSFYQGCTVGGYNEKDGSISYPELLENVVLYPHSSVIGKCKIGPNTNIGPGTIVKNQNISGNCNVFGQSPNLIIKKWNIIKP